MDLAACGVIGSDTFVWCQGMTDWKRAGEVSEFRLKVPAATPPPFAQAPPSSPNYPQMYPREFAQLIPSKPKSPHSRVASGVLNILLPGVGRMYLGFTGVGVLQLVTTICSGGLLYIWPLIDGILMLAGSVREDALGRQLES
jgi:TM2 domain-containing membrane protein YozV